MDAAGAGTAGRERREPQWARHSHAGRPATDVRPGPADGPQTGDDNRHHHTGARRHHHVDSSVPEPDGVLSPLQLDCSESSSATVE
eukprot:2537769-Prymnesium_polylepis.2